MLWSAAERYRISEAPPPPLLIRPTLWQPLFAATNQSEGSASRSASILFPLSHALTLTHWILYYTGQTDAIKLQSLDLKMYRWGFSKYSTKCSIIICVDVSHLFSIRVYIWRHEGRWLLAICNKMQQNWKEKIQMIASVSKDSLKPYTGLTTQGWME